MVDRQRGAPVFFSVLSSAHTLRIGSFSRSSAIVTRSAVPSSCLTCTIDPVSDALNDRRTLKPEEMMWTKPSVVPRKRFAEPVQSDEISDCVPIIPISRLENGEGRGWRTLKFDKLSSGSFTGVTSKKLNAFH